MVKILNFVDSFRNFVQLEVLGFAHLLVSNSCNLPVLWQKLNPWHIATVLPNKLACV